MITYPFGDRTVAKKKRVVVTVTFGPTHDKVAELTHPLIKKYARNHGADFRVIRNDDREFPTLHPSYEDWQTFNLLNHYDEVVHLDTDVVLAKEADWLLAVSAGRFAAFDELHRNERKQDWNEWQGRRYYNLGVWGCTRQHAILWSEMQPSNDVDGHQDFLNLRLLRLGIPVYDVGPEYNTMCYDWHGDYSTYDYRTTANIIHYAGIRNSEELLNRIKADIDGLRALGRNID